MRDHVRENFGDKRRDKLLAFMVEKPNYLASQESSFLMLLFLKVLCKVVTKYLMLLKEHLFALRAMKAHIRSNAKHTSSDTKNQGSPWITQIQGITTVGGSKYTDVNHLIRCAMQWDCWSCNCLLEVHEPCNLGSLFILKTKLNFNIQDYTEYLVPVLHNCFLFQMNFLLITRLRKLLGEFKCNEFKMLRDICNNKPLIDLHQAFLLRGFWLELRACLCVEILSLPLLF